MKILRTAITCLAILAGGVSAAQAQTSRFPGLALLNINPRAEITIPLADVKLDGPGGTFANIKLLVNNPMDLFGYAVNDPSVQGPEVEINLIDQRIRIPLLRFDNELSFSQVSLPVSAVTVLSFEVPDRIEKPWKVNITVTAAGIEQPMLTLEDVPRPDTQAQFCGNSDVHTPIINQHVPQPNDWRWRVLRCEYKVVGDMAMGRIDLEANIGPDGVRNYSGAYLWFR